MKYISLSVIFYADQSYFPVWTVQVCGYMFFFCKAFCNSLDMGEIEFFPPKDSILGNSYKTAEGNFHII